MAYNGSGTFLINSAGQPVVAGTTISETVFNALTADLATGLSTAITKDGQTTAIANLPMGGFKLTNLAAGTAATDSARLGQVQSGATTLIAITGTDTVVGTLTPTLTAYATGQQFSFVAAATNTTSMTLNINGLGAKAITKTGATALIAGDITVGKMITVIYDGTQFQTSDALVPASTGVSGLPALLRGYIDGLTLSRASATTIGIAAGTATNSTAASSITLASAFTKSTAGAWASGSGSNGMGLTLVIANNTWYHVFAIIAAGVADVYFDTSVTAANNPAGTTAFRRIGSFLTDGSAQIVPFSQIGDEFLWLTPILDVNTGTLSTARTLFPITVPLGVKVNAIFSASANAAASVPIVVFTSPDQNDISASFTTGAHLAAPAAATNAAGQFNVRTDTSRQIGARSSQASTALACITFGYIDTRGKNS